MSGKEAVKIPPGLVLGDASNPLAIDPVAHAIACFCNEIVARHQTTIEPACFYAFSGRCYTKRRAIERSLISSQQFDRLFKQPRRAGETSRRPHIFRRLGHWHQSSGDFGPVVGRRSWLQDIFRAQTRYEQFHQACVILWCAAWLGEQLVGRRFSFRDIVSRNPNRHDRGHKFNAREPLFQKTDNVILAPRWLRECNLESGRFDGTAAAFVLEVRRQFAQGELARR